MRKTIFLLAIIFSLTISIYPQDNGFGAGLIVGEPTGFTIKNWISSTSAIDAGLGWSFVDNGSTHIHVDYLYHNFNVIKVSDAKIPLYFGVGGRLKFRNEEKVADNRFGVEGTRRIGVYVPDSPCRYFS